MIISIEENVNGRANTSSMNPGGFNTETEENKKRRKKKLQGGSSVLHVCVKFFQSMI